jgi:hypothetical protein
MSRLHATHLKLVGASSAALLIAGMAASPALAAPVTINYTCGPVVLPITIDPGTLPTSLTAGQKVNQPFTSANVHLDAATVGVAQAQGWTSVSGTSTADGTKPGTPYKLTIPQTAVPQTAGATLDLAATGSLALQAKTAGSYKVFAGDSTAFIQGYNASGPANTITLPCAAPTDGSTTFGTITVKKDTTKTKASASDAGTTVKGKAKVKSHFGLKPTGKVSFTLMKGTHKVATAKGKLSATGVAKATFKNVTKAGKYTLKAAFKGDKALKGSKGTTTVKVK